MGSKRAWWWGAVSTLLVLLLLDVTPVRAQGAGLSRLLNVDPNDWPMYHRTYDSHRFSPLGQINKTNVKDLGVAWVHQPGAVVQGLESTPIVVDGVLYYSGSYNRVFALDGATGGRSGTTSRSSTRSSTRSSSSPTTAAWRSGTARCSSARSTAVSWRST